MKCPFFLAYIGLCDKEGDPYCEKHKKEKCWYCKEQATGQCSVAVSLVCGYSQCNKHPHDTPVAHGGTGARRYYDRS